MRANIGLFCSHLLKINTDSFNLNSRQWLKVIFRWAMCFNFQLCFGCQHWDRIVYLEIYASLRSFEAELSLQSCLKVPKISSVNYLALWFTVEWHLEESCSDTVASFLQSGSCTALAWSRTAFATLLLLLLLLQLDQFLVSYFLICQRFVQRFNLSFKSLVSLVHL